LFSFFLLDLPLSPSIDPVTCLLPSGWLQIEEEAVVAGGALAHATMRLGRDQLKRLTAAAG